MKKLEPPSSNSDQLRGLRLFRDDLEFLIELFRRDVGTPRLSDDHFEFDTLEELIEHRGAKPRKLEVDAKSAGKEYLSIIAKFENGKVWLHGTRGTPFHEAKDFLLSRRPLAFYLLSPWLWFYAVCVWMNVVVATASETPNGHLNLSMWSVYVLLVVSVLFVGGLIHREFDFGLRLSRRHEGGFLAKNLDKILLALISAAIGVIATLVAKYLGS